MAGFSVGCVKANGYTPRVERWRQVLVDAWKQNRISRDDLANQTELNRGTIHRILDDKTRDPSFNTVVKLAEAFGPHVAHEVAQTISPVRAGRQERSS